MQWTIQNGYPDEAVEYDQHHPDAQDQPVPSCSIDQSLQEELDSEEEGVEEEVVSSIEAKRSRGQGASKERKPRIQQS